MEEADKEREVAFKKYFLIYGVKNITLKEKNTRYNLREAPKHYTIHGDPMFGLMFN